MNSNFAIITAVALSAGLAHAGTIASGSAANGGNTIRAYSGTHSFANAYNGGAMTMFPTFTNAHFAAAQAAPTASTLASPLHPNWNNPGNAAGGFVQTGLSTAGGAAALNNAGARWVHDHTNFNTAHSVLYAVPFLVGNVSTTSMTITWLTDNGFGNTNGANSIATPAGFANDGMFVNGTSLGYSSPGGSVQPAQFADITSLTFTNIAVTPNSKNWLYLYQFNWGGPGGSAFSIEGVDISVIPNPIAALSGSLGLMIVAARRRRA